MCRTKITLDGWSSVSYIRNAACGMKWCIEQKSVAGCSNIKNSSKVMTVDGAMYRAEISEAGWNSVKNYSLDIQWVRRDVSSKNQSGSADQNQDSSRQMRRGAWREVSSKNLSSWIQQCQNFMYRYEIMTWCMEQKSLWLDTTVSNTHPTGCTWNDVMYYRAEISLAGRNSVKIRLSIWPWYDVMYRAKTSLAGWNSIKIHPHSCTWCDVMYRAKISLAGCSSVKN